jgi:hypothetical protein
VDGPYRVHVVRVDGGAVRVKLPDSFYVQDGGRAEWGRFPEGTVLLTQLVKAVSRVPAQPVQAQDAPKPRAALEPPRESHPLMGGDRVVITSKALFTGDKASYNEVHDLIAAGDAHGLARMAEQGRFFAVEGGTEGLLLGDHGFAKWVRVTSGRFAGRDGYVDSKFVRNAD